MITMIAINQTITFVILYLLDIYIRCYANIYRKKEYNDQNNNESFAHLINEVSRKK